MIGGLITSTVLTLLVLQAIYLGRETARGQAARGPQMKGIGLNSDIEAAQNAQAIVRRGRQLEYFTVAYKCLEGIVSLIAGLFSGSISLVGFGLDSFIEVTSGAALIWRLGHEADARRRADAERTSLRIVGACFGALAAYIAYDSAGTLIRHETPERSIPGILVAIASLIVMPLLARAKRKVARSLNSAAMHADSRQTDFCTYLSPTL